MKCELEGCGKPPRMAVRTRRPNRDQLTSQVWYDDRTAPKAAARYCKAHGREVVGQLVDTLTSMDEL